MKIDILRSVAVEDVPDGQSRYTGVRLQPCESLAPAEPKKICREAYEIRRFQQIFYRASMMDINPVEPIGDPAWTHLAEPVGDGASVKVTYERNVVIADEAIDAYMTRIISNSEALIKEDEKLRTALRNSVNAFSDAREIGFIRRIFGWKKAMLECGERISRSV